MQEWILIIAMSLDTLELGQVRDVSPTVVGGFSSQESCTVAARTVSTRLIALSGTLRSRAGIPGNLRVSSPTITYECVAIRK